MWDPDTSRAVLKSAFGRPFGAIDAPVCLHRNADTAHSLLSSFDGGQIGGSRHCSNAGHGHNGYRQRKQRHNPGRNTGAYGVYFPPGSAFRLHGSWQHNIAESLDDRRILAPTAQMISSCSLPATGQIYPFSDGRRQLGEGDRAVTVSTQLVPTHLNSAHLAQKMFGEVMLQPVFMRLFGNS